MDRRSISNIECGNTFPSTSLAAIAKKLETDLKEFFDLIAQKKTNEKIIEEINSKLPKLTNEQLKIIYRLIEIM